MTELINKIEKSLKKKPQDWYFIKAFDLPTLQHEYYKIKIQQESYQNPSHPDNYVIRLSGKRVEDCKFTISKGSAPAIFNKVLTQKRIEYQDNLENAHKLLINEIMLKL